MGMMMTNMAITYSTKGTATPAEATPMGAIVGCPQGSSTGMTPFHVLMFSDATLAILFLCCVASS
jgi:hypothetical protein